jgi:serine protease AprX
MVGPKQFVEAVLYGSGDRRRFTLDSPVLSDVWTRYFEDPEARLSLLIEPWLDSPAFELGEKLMALEGIEQKQARITYNRTVVIADLSLRELVEQILPLTGWYREATNQPIGTKEVFAPRLPKPEEIWDDLSVIDPIEERFPMSGDRRGRSDNRVLYRYPRLLGMIRIVGLIAFFAQAEPPRLPGFIDDELYSLLNGDELEARLGRDRMASIVLRGWQAMELYLRDPAEKIIYSVNRNRAAKLAVHQSVRTVKADAANSLFSIDCSNLTWAIMDSGIDRFHPAFARRSADENEPAVTRSRVSETYDFSYLRELLTTDDWDALPPHIGKAVSKQLTTIQGHEEVKLRRELVTRIRRGKLIDWEALRPFLRVAHDEADYVRPIDPHGTHVAGILGSDWDREDKTVMKGMCPTINLIDVRVCREDGSSDEFVIMSALQFLRHLNANSDRMAVHGVNMSLSLEHDASVYACGRTPVCEEAERTIASGVVVVAAAGNHGYRRILADNSEPFDQYCPVSITDPGNAENVITVGSTHRLEPHTYGVSYFSSRGPTGDGRAKPDLVAPGEKIYAPALHGDALRLDGTSMAVPHVSGAAAMLMARHVELEGEPMRIKRILCSTATDLGREPYFQGRGLVDVLRAIQSV